MVFKKVWMGEERTALRFPAKYSYLYRHKRLVNYEKRI